MRAPGWASVVIVGAFLLASFGPTQAAAPAHRASQLQLFDSHIDHVVFLMQENHAFDSLFGVYCPTTGTYCKTPVIGVPNKCIPLYPGNTSLGCVTPYNFTAADLAPSDMEHDWYSTHTAYDNGKMDNFYVAEGYTKETFGHYNASTVPFYWDLAEQYGLADNFFSSDASYSLPNHWGMVASMPPAETQQNYMGYAGTAVDQQYLNEANQTSTIESELLNSSVTWRYFDFGLPTYSGAQSLSGIWGTAYDYWNPLAARAQTYQVGVKNHFVPRANFFGDAANGTLPNISWVIPTVADSDHPNANLTTGQEWVASVVDALEKSPEWNSTVLFLSWDEYGGFYDQVAPPITDANGTGFRVPMLAIGPWVKQGYVSHTQMTFDSILHLMEVRFGLKCLGPRDCKAKLPLDMFDFKGSPRAPIGFATNASWSYPMPLQSSGQLPYYGAATAFAPAIDNAPPGDFTVLDWG